MKDATPPLIVAAAKLVTHIQWAAPQNYSRAPHVPQIIVLHCTDGAEGVNADINNAAEIVKPLPKGKRKSWHYIVDADSCTYQVHVNFTAWHAGETGNKLGIGVEICGRASQTFEQWTDPTSLATLQNAARLVADLCTEFKLPARFLDPEELRGASPRGITTHAAVSKAFRESTHTDPGPGFPLIEFIEAVSTAMGSQS
jgi:N-acetyl-anhydromuramyl-L-alanine amidase AmpD